MNKENYRVELANWIHGMSPTYHLTVSFLYWVSDIEAEGALQEIIKRLNREVFTRRYVKKNLFVSGVVARERNHVGTLHYHMVLVYPDEQLPSQKMMQEVLSSMRSKLVSKRGAMQLMPADGFLLQSYYDAGQGGLEFYVTKNIVDKRLTTQEAIDSFGVIDIGGVHFGDIPVSGKGRVFCGQSKKVMAIGEGKMARINRVIEDGNALMRGTF